MTTTLIAIVGAAIGVLTFTLTFVTYVWNVGGQMVEQATRVLVALDGPDAVLKNLSEGPVSQVEIFYGTSALSLDRSPNLVEAGKEIRAALPATNSRSSDSLVATYVGARGLRWQRWADGRIALVGPRARFTMVKVMTWPWLSHELRRSS